MDLLHNLLSLFLPQFITILAGALFFVVSLLYLVLSIGLKIHIFDKFFEYTIIIMAYLRFDI